MTGLTIDELKYFKELVDRDIESSEAMMEEECCDFTNVFIMNFYALRASALSKLNVIIGEEQLS